MREVGFLVVGGGPAGLGAASALAEAGRTDWLLVERQDVLGGLSRSFVDDSGYTWDIGGHVVFSHYGTFDRVLDSSIADGGWLHHDRESWVRILQRWVPYPFQNNIHRLPPEEQADCLAGLIQAAIAGKDPACSADFGELVDTVFGEGVARLFMRPYNFKVWAHPLDMLDWRWMGERVAIPDPVRVARNVVLGRDDTGWGPNNRFRFPRHGGTGAIWEAVASKLPSANIVRGTDMRSVDLEKREAVLATGETVSYDTMVSTIPLDLLAAACGRLDWVRATSALRRSAVHVVGVGLAGGVTSNVEGKCWMYFPEQDTPFYRVTNFAHYSPDNVPDAARQWSLMTETSESDYKPVDTASLEDDVVGGLVRQGLVSSAADVDHVWRHRVENGYPTPTRDRDSIVDPILRELMRAGVYSRGRFGAWKYEVANMDHSFMQGWEAVRNALNGTPEQTVWNPALVNAGHRAEA